MKYMENLRRWGRSIRINAPLVVAVAFGGLPLVANLSVPEVTPIRYAASTPSVLFLAWFAVSWKAFVAYFRAVDEVKRQHSADKLISARRRELQAMVERQGQAVVTADSVAAMEAARRALTVTIEEYKSVTYDLIPRLERTRAAIARADALRNQLPHIRAMAWARRSAARQVSIGLTTLAVAVAGQRGARMRDTWTADLVGAPEEGLSLGRLQQVMHALGFVVAALRMRGHALGAPLWRPVDWLLTSESRTRPAITVAVGAQVIYIVKEDGLHGLLTEGWGWCGACAIALTVFFRWLRRVRGIELATTARDTSAE